VLQSLVLKERGEKARKKIKQKLVMNLKLTYMEKNKHLKTNQLRFWWNKDWF